MHLSKIIDNDMCIKILVDEERNKIQAKLASKQKYRSNQRLNKICL